MIGERRQLAGQTVVKLGGSHALEPHLHDWLAALAACAGHIIVVPGGGLFADAVRQAQARMGFDDQAAHRMALLAMEQFAAAIVALQPRFVATASLDAMRQARRDGFVPVWLPTRMALAATDLPVSWDVTSDSLAAWLTRRTGASRILLVKHGVSPGPVRLSELVARGVIDPLFGRCLGDGRSASLAGPADHATAATAICGGVQAGVPIELDG